VVALATGLGFGVFALTPAAHASTDVAAVTFGPTNGEQAFAVPLGVTSVHVDTVGGHGGASRVGQDHRHRRRDPLSGADRTFRTR
jgi:hypothetical protein